MRSLLIITFCIVIFPAYCQHDFDSLYNTDDHFREVIERYLKEYDLFNISDPLEITLISDFKNLMKHKFEDDYQDAVLKFHLNDTIIVNRNVEIKPRGNYRRKNCFNPPLKINFKKMDVFLPQLKEFDKMKMVDVCRNSDLYEQYLITEYLVYKMYNELTDLSFRVRLLTVNYIDLGGKYKPRTRYAFFIEDIEQLAGRLDAGRYQKERISPSSTDQEFTSRLDVFQYMIGNTDYYIPMEHNIKMIKLKDVTRPRPIVIPYDFDYAGIVDAQYAVPSELLPIEDVKQRYYRGDCHSEKRYDEIFEELLEKKDDIYSVIYDSPYLLERTQKYIINYLDQFYDNLLKPNLLIGTFNRDCNK